MISTSCLNKNITGPSWSSSHYNDTPHPQMTGLADQAKENPIKDRITEVVGVPVIGLKISYLLMA